MTNTQVTLIQIDNYGPWTVTPEPRREPDLQALQADLYADLARLFGVHDAYVFFTRFDNVVAITNGVDRAAHARIQTAVANRYPVTVSMGTGRGRTPAAALTTATERLQAAGSAQEADRREVLEGQPETVDGTADDVQIAHFDVVDVTGEVTDRVDAYTAFTHVERVYVELMTHLHATHDALSFFVGGDNFIAVCPSLDRDAYEGAVDHVQEAAGADLRVGVGRGATACGAGIGAKVALEECRDRDLVVSGDLPAVTER